MNLWQILVSAVIGGAITYIITRQNFNYRMREIYFAEKKRALEDIIKNICGLLEVLKLLGSIDNKQSDTQEYRNKLNSQYSGLLSVSYEMIGRLGLYCDRKIVEKGVNLYDEIGNMSGKNLVMFSGKDEKGWKDFRQNTIYPILTLLSEELKKTVGIKI